jgi:chromosome segregation ATPase
MSSINTNERRTSRIHLRSATRRQNTPSALARRTRILETRRTNLANTIRELETDLRQQRRALDTLTIEVDQALSRREDDKERYETLREQKEQLKITIRDNFRQSDLGMEYRELKQRYDELVKNGGIDTDNIEKRLHELGYTFKQLVKTNIAAVKAEIEIAREIYKTASEHHHSLYQGQQYIIGVISDLERKLEQALKSDRALNQARGKKQRRSTYKRGKKGKNTRKKKTIKTRKIYYII